MMKEIRFYFSTTEYTSYLVDEDWEELDMWDLLDDNAEHFDIEKDKLNLVAVRINMKRILMVAFMEVQKRPEDAIYAEVK